MGNSSGTWRAHASKAWKACATGASRRSNHGRNVIIIHLVVLRRLCPDALKLTQEMLLLCNCTLCVVGERRGGRPAHKGAESGSLSAPLDEEQVDGPPWQLRQLVLHTC